MSNIFRSENLDKDYENFQKALLKTSEFKYQITEDNKPFFKKYHRLTYVIALFLHKVEELHEEENKYIFLNEILSDLLVNSSVSIIGFFYSSQFIVRRLIENFYNHIYFFDHPIELEHLNLGKNEYTPIVELKNYLENYPLLKKVEDDHIKNANTDIFNHYQELCKPVHTKGENFMGLAKTLEEIKPDFDFISHIKSINKSILNIIYILYKFHIEIKFSHVEKDLVIKSFPKDVRGILLS